MNRKDLILVTIYSAAACLLYSLMLFSPYNLYWQTSAAKILLFVMTPLLYYKTRGRKAFSGLFNKAKNKAYIKISAALGGAAFILIIAAYFLLNWLFDKDMILGGLKREGITHSIYPFVFINIVLVNAFLEELFFRGFVFFTIFRLGFKAYAYAFSSVLFALYHIAMMGGWFSPPAFIFCLTGLVFAGLVFCRLDEGCGNIYGGLFVHLGANLAINLIGAYLFYL